MDEKCACIRVAVEHAKLKRICDAFTVEKTVEEIICCFEFRTSDWDELQKTAVFIKEGEENVTPIHVLLDENHSCVVPAEVLNESGEFSLGVFGIDGTHRLPTNLLRFKINEGCYRTGTEPSPPTANIYEQIIAQLGQKQDKLIAGENIILNNNIISIASEAITDKTYVHTQKVASDTWYIKHNLGKFPSVSVVDSAKTIIVCDIDYINENELVIKSKSPFSGTCYCN